MRAGPRFIALVLLLTSVVSCEDLSTPLVSEPSDGSLVRIEQASMTLQVGEQVALTAVDENGADITRDVLWRVVDATTLGVRDNSVTARAPGFGMVVAQRGARADSLRVTVPFGTSIDSGLALRLGGVADLTLALTGISFVYDRLDSDADVTHIMASPTGSDPLEPPALDFALGQSQVFVRLPVPPVADTFRFQSATLHERPDGSFELRGDAGVEIWTQNPAQPWKAELYVSVGEFELVIESASRPDYGQEQSGALTGRIAFEAAGFVVALDDGPPHIVDQIGTETVSVYGEFGVDLRTWPLGAGTTQITGGPAPLGVTAIVPDAKPHNGGLLLDVSVAVPATTEQDFYSTQVWLGSPGIGPAGLTAIDDAGLRAADSYAPDLAWGWTGLNRTDLQAILYGEADVLGYSSGGTVEITRYVPAGERGFGILEGTFVMPQVVTEGAESAGEQTVLASFSAPIYPLALAAYHGRPPVLDRNGDPGDPPDSDASYRRFGYGDGILRGSVLEDDRFAVSGAAVTLMMAETIVTAVSNAEGGFGFYGLPAGDYTLELEVPAGHQLAAGQQAVMTPLVVAEAADIRMDLDLADAAGNGSLLVHALVEPSGDALPGLGVRVRDPESGDLVAEGTTDGRGRFDRKILPGVYDVESIPPTGYMLANGTDSVMRVRINRGHTTMEPVITAVVEPAPPNR